MMTRIWGDRLADRTNAINSLMAHCGSTWATNNDLEQAADIMNGAIGYDLLHDLLTQEQQTVCRDKIAVSAKALADAADAGVSGGGWWKPDLVQNHNWVNYAAIGVAGQALEGEALEGEDPNAEHWRNIARENFRKVASVQNLIKDGSWHEGIGYLEFGLLPSIIYWLGAVRRGTDNDRTDMLSKVGRYVLYAQLPNQPRAHVMTHADWNWSRPSLLATLRWAAMRFKDSRPQDASYAQEAAKRWDLLGRRVLGQEYGLAYAVEYVAFEPAVALPTMANVPLDIYNEDEQSVILRSSWNYGLGSPASDTLVVGFKAGVFGGHGNYERIKADRDKMNPDPGGILNIGHAHMDDLSLWIYGKGGWLLPETVAYNCCFPNDRRYYSTEYHNSFLFDGRGQYGDERNFRLNQNGRVVHDAVKHPWFFDREASMPLHASTEHYAFARGDGKRLYPSELNVTTLLRTVGFSRENDGFVALQDRVVLSTARKIEQVFHSLTPQDAPSTDVKPWLKLTNLNTQTDRDLPNPSVRDTVLGIRVLSPQQYTVDLTSSPQKSDKGNYINRTYICPSGDPNAGDKDCADFGYVRVAPTAPASSVVFLEVLWPTTDPEWASRPNVQPLDAANPDRGFSIPLNASTESWIYNTSGTTTSAGDLTIQGNSPDDIGIRRMAGDGRIERVVLQGGGKLLDQNGARTLLDLGKNRGVLEVAFTGTRADLSGTASIIGVAFYGPNVTEVRRQGEKVPWRRSGSMVTLEPLDLSWLSLLLE